MKLEDDVIKGCTIGDIIKVYLSKLTEEGINKLLDTPGTDNINLTTEVTLYIPVSLIKEKYLDDAMISHSRNFVKSVYPNCKKLSKTSNFYSICTECGVTGKCKIY